MRTDQLWGRLAAGVAVVALVVAGCSDADGNARPTDGPAEVTTEPTPTAKPTATETPGPGPTAWPEPTRPPEMERDDVEGAKAAAEYFLELYPYVYVTGDLEAWHEISHPECMFCAGVVENVEELHADGGYADGPRIEIVSADAQAPTDEYEYFAVQITAVEHPSSRFNSSGEIIASQPGARLDAEMALELGTGVWRVRGAVVTPQEGAEE